MGRHLKLKANFHTHTNMCDGRDTPEEMVRKALELGFFTVGFSGHMDPDINMDYEVYEKEIYRLKEKYKDRIEILCGVEIDNMSGKDMLEQTASADYRIGSTHFLNFDSEELPSVDSSEVFIKKIADEYFHGDYYKLAASYYEFEAKIYDRTACTFVGHFDLVTRFNDTLHFVDESDPRYYMPALTAMEHLAGQGIPFEINMGAVNRGRKAQPYPNLFLLRHLKEFGGEIIINSDAHQKELLNGCFDQAVEAAISCGFTHTNVLTKRNGKLELLQLALDTEQV